MKRNNAKNDDVLAYIISMLSFLAAQRMHNFILYAVGSTDKRAEEKKEVFDK